MNMQIPEDLHRIHGMFSDAGEQLFVVGGAVRDTLLNKVPKDFDLVTGAEPDQVIQILEQDPSLRIDLTGKAFGVVRARFPSGFEVEIATFRKDVGSGRRPDAVEFTTIEDDVRRRDLTVNAMFFDLDTNEVVDFVGGIDDLRNRVIRTVGEPARRFAEDPLRVLRAVRFAARMGSELDDETREAILADEDLAGVSVDRIQEEFVKGLKQAKLPDVFIHMLGELDLFRHILPGLWVEPGMASDDRDPAVQLALIIAEPDVRRIKNVMQGMKFTRKQIDEVTFFKQFLDFNDQVDGGDFSGAVPLKREFARLRMDPEKLRTFAGEEGGVPTARFADKFSQFASSPPVVDARELMAQGLKGPQIGQAMRQAENEEFERLVNEALLRTLVSEVLSRR
jgi:tRNA nucleotidyltransferase/poly(A) polymerase